MCLAVSFLKLPPFKAVASRLTHTTMTFKSHYCYDLQNNHHKCYSSTGSPHAEEDYPVESSECNQSF